jgi:ribonucleoside-diphosphate reductase alpha chain
MRPGGTGGESVAPINPEKSAKKEYSDEEAIACSLENPESCEACQ